MHFRCVTHSAYLLVISINICSLYYSTTLVQSLYHVLSIYQMLMDLMVRKTTEQTCNERTICGLTEEEIMHADDRFN